ncbi:Uncharacterised protein [Lachnospira pectinoschiza]|nr:Uncharacterised protein [Lachnospira pectinoschiza]
MKNINNITDNTIQAVHSAENGINAITGSQSSITIKPDTARKTTEAANVDTARNPSAAIRQYKDNVFCLLYRDKNNLLDLYNGLNDTNYTNVDDLTVTTLKGGIYMKYKNDASFVFGQDLYMFEQQSSRNPNMPLRFLHYLSDVYRQMYTNSDLHRSTTLKIPVPHFVTFYNGKQPLEAESTLRLSDMYEKNIDCPELELIVRVININTANNAGNKSRTFNSNINDNSASNSNMHTYSSEFLSKCETLKDYMTFVNKVRVKTDVEKIDIRTAVTEAVDECIAENVLSEFFRNHREEVITVSIYEYDEEGHLEIVKEEGRQLGIAEGRQLGLDEGKQLGLTEGLNKGINAFIKLCKDTNLSDDDTITKLIEDYQLSKDEAIKAVKNY